MLFHLMKMGNLFQQESIITGIYYNIFKSQSSFVFQEHQIIIYQITMLLDLQISKYNIMFILVYLITLVYSQSTSNPIFAYLSSTYTNPPQLNLTFSTPLNATPSFQIFTAFTQVKYQISQNTANQTYIIKPTQPNHILAETITLMFNQPQDINLSIDSFVLTIEVTSGYFSTFTAPIIVCIVAILMSIYGSAGIMMIQFIQVFTQLKAINLFYYSFFSSVHNYIFFRWGYTLFYDIPESMFLNSCFSMMLIYAITITITIVVWKLIRDPTNPILKWIKKVFNFSFIIIVFRITMIPFGVGIINNFIVSFQKPTVNATLIVNQIICIIFSFIYLSAFVYVIWFMHYSKIKDYQNNKTYGAYRKIYMDIETNKGYKKFYVTFLYLKVFFLTISCVLQYGVMVVVVFEDFQIFMIMISRPYKSYRYYQMMLFTVSSQFLSYLVQCTGFMFKHLGITILQNNGYFTFDTVSLVFFAIAWFNLLLISMYEAYTKLKMIVDKIQWQRRQSQRMIEMSRMPRRNSITKRESLLVSRSRQLTQL